MMFFFNKEYHRVFYFLIPKRDIKIYLYKKELPLSTTCYLREVLFYLEDGKSSSQCILLLHHSHGIVLQRDEYGSDVGIPNLQLQHL